jgi:hypothetical protein
MTLKMDSTYSTLTPCGLQELWDSMVVTPDGVQIKSIWSPAGVQAGVWLSVKCSPQPSPRSIAEVKALSWLQVLVCHCPETSHHQNLDPGQTLWI